MDDYNRYVTAINKIFDYLEKMKAGWNNNDNKNYIETIEDFKGTVTAKAELYKKPPTVQVTHQEIEETENEATGDEEIEENVQQPAPAEPQEVQPQQGMIPQITTQQVAQQPVQTSSAQPMQQQDQSLQQPAQPLQQPVQEAAPKKSMLQDQPTNFPVELGDQLTPFTQVTVPSNMEGLSE